MLKKGTLFVLGNAEVFEGGILRLADGAAPGTPITLAGQTTLTALEPVWARVWQNARASVFSPDRGSIYYLPNGANDAKVLGCLSDDFTVYALVGHGAEVYALLSTPEEETYGIARFDLP